MQPFVGKLNPHQMIRPQDHYLGTLDFIVI